MTALMIDGAGSLDRDDAITVTEYEDGWSATVHVAAVADAVALGSQDDRAALARAQTRYLRDSTEPMIGRDLEEVATLSTTQPRPTVAIAMRFTRDGTLTSSSIRRDHLPAGAAMAYTHQQVGIALAADSADPEHQQLHAAYRLARTLIASRQATGAFAVFDASRGLVTSEEGRLVALQSGQVPAAYLIVQELMIAANSTLARWAIDLELPILFRNHVRSTVAPPAGDLLADVTAELSTHATMPPDALQALTARVNQTLRPAIYQPVVVGHFGLQLPAYTHSTSPLRRYADLVTQRQVLAHLDGAKLPYSPAVLEDLAATLNDTLRERAEKKSAAASATRRKQAAKTIASGDYSHSQGRDWLRVLRIAVDTALPDGLAAELRRRAEAGDLDGGQLAVMMRATGQGWPDLLAQLLGIAQQVTPQYAASAISAWHHTEHSTRPAPEVEYRQAGPPHEPSFTARVTFADVTSSWAVGASKKLAERKALWELVEILAGVREATAPSGPPAEVEEYPLQQSSDHEAAQTPTLVDLTPLSGRNWLRAVRALITDPGKQEQALTRELLRRAAAGTLDAPAMAALLADDTGRWRPLLGELVATMRTTAPHEANSTLSAWRQLQDAAIGAPDLEVRQFGQPHAPVFAIRAQHEQWLTEWQVGPAKKAVTQQALWDLVGVIAGTTTAGAPDDEPAVPEPTTGQAENVEAGSGREARQAVVPPPTHGRGGPLLSTPADVTASAPPLAEAETPDLDVHLTSALGATPADRVRKYRNAVKSPTAWINNLAAVLNSDAPECDFVTIDGGYTATVTVDTPLGEIVDSGSGTNQKTARAVASLAILHRLFSIT